MWGIWCSFVVWGGVGVLLVFVFELMLQAIGMLPRRDLGFCWDFLFLVGVGII